VKAAVIFLLGVLVTAAGVLFTLQGAGAVRSPAESFMIGTRDWIEYGIVIAMIGVGLMLTARKIRKG
jgi:hypothetical protein